MLGAPTPMAALLEPIRSAPELSAVLLDVDGTLAPIVARPDAARLLPGAHEVLLALRDRMALLGFVSGRALADVERLVSIPGCAYAGNHGMELRHPGGPATTAPSAAEQLAPVARFAADWPADELARHGIWIEDKTVSLAFHYRTASEPLVAEAYLAGTVAPAAVAAGLRARPGRRILEVLPAVGVTKGTAVRALLGDGVITRAAYAGDDRTDIDAWRALGELRDEGRLEAVARIAVAGIEVPPEVRAEADVEVAGPHGLLAALRDLIA